MDFELTENLPDTCHEDYVALHGRFLADLPLGDQSNMMTPPTHADLIRLSNTMVENKQHMLILFLRNPKGERVGFSELTVSGESGKAVQGLTGLLPAYRGQGLAKALKAKLFLLAQACVPSLRYISTTTSPHNARMMHINLEMGFKIEQQTSQVTITPEDVDRFLDGFSPALAGPGKRRS
jgi:RimJ/RimL family protein N-acetyltransferase